MIVFGLLIGPLSAGEIEPAIPHHVDQHDIESGKWNVDQLIEAGRRLFVAKFTKADGLGRPAATGSPFPLLRRTPDTVNEFARGQGPDANSCASCHREPFIGGAGDFTANVFTGLGQRTISTAAIDVTLANERGTPALQGSGILELLAREITADLHAIRDQASIEASQHDKPVRVELVSKGIPFGWLTADPSGEIDATEVDGIDRDLVVRPFGAKGTITSLREFTINAANLHHGMQADERYGLGQTAAEDFDQDGVVTELTEGDITALTVFQAALPCPGRVRPLSREQQAAVLHGERVFRDVGCAICHPLELELNSTIYTEPNPYNFEGNLRPEEGRPVLSADLAVDGESPRVTKRGNTFVVHAMTDFKRHDLSDSDHDHLQNETVFERFLPTEVFVTRPLWGCGSTAPYGHRGDLVTLDEIIAAHGGEAGASRERYDQRSEEDRIAVRQFLQSHQILPPGSPSVIEEVEEISLPYTSR